MDQSEQGPSGGVTAHLTIRDGRAADAIDFYARAFGAEEVGRHMAEDGKRILHAHLKLNGGSLMLNDEFPEFMSAPSTPPGSFVLHLQVPDADAAWEKAVGAGAEVRFPLGDQFWGDRYGQVEDPFGFTWSIGAPVKQGQQQSSHQPSEATA
jgi:PhnB protein